MRWPHTIHNWCWHVYNLAAVHTLCGCLENTKIHSLLWVTVLFVCVWQTHWIESQWDETSKTGFESSHNQSQDTIMSFMKLHPDRFFYTLRQEDRHQYPSIVQPSNVPVSIRFTSKRRIIYLFESLANLCERYLWFIFTGSKSGILTSPSYLREIF